MRIDGKTAVITGAASGIGRATAETLAQAGAHVLLGDIALEAGEQSAAAIRAKGFGADFIRLDVTDLDSIEAFKHAAYARREHVDIVANVAGWGKVEPFVKNTPDFWRKVIDLNLFGPIAVTRAFLDDMIERKAGKVVIVSSDAGRVGSLGESVYAGAKGGAIAFTKSLAREMARFNINVNCVCPGPTDTPLLAAVPEKHREAFVRVTPMGRLAQPSEIADAVLFFASSRASFRHRPGSERQRRAGASGLNSYLSIANLQENHMYKLKATEWRPQHFKWEVKDRVGTVTLNRPERKNPLTLESYAELRDTFHKLQYAEDVRAVVFTGEGGNFCSGGDVHEIIGPLTKMDMTGLITFTRMTGNLVKEMRTCPQPIIAAVDGICAGAGAIISMAQRPALRHAGMQDRVPVCARRPRRLRHGRLRYFATDHRTGPRLGAVLHRARNVGAGRAGMGLLQ